MPSPNIELERLEKLLLKYFELSPPSNLHKNYIEFHNSPFHILINFGINLNDVYIKKSTVPSQYIYYFFTNDLYFNEMLRMQKDNLDIEAVSNLLESYLLIYS